MSETMSHVERLLWRIAELGARCSQQGAAGGRGPLWAELEQTIADLEAEFESARQAGDIAPAQVRSLEGRLKVALQQRDQEKARVKESFDDAEAARRERDRERAKARKAVAAAVQARSFAAEVQAAVAAATARCTAAEAATDQAKAARDEALAARDEAFAARDDALNALEKAIVAGEHAADARDAAVVERDKAVRGRHKALRALEAADARIAELEAALAAAETDRTKAADARIAELEAALAAAETDRTEAVDALAARAEGAVVVLPGVAVPETPAAPAPKTSRVSWQPTWSEWANPADDTTAATVSERAATGNDTAVVSLTDDAPSDDTGLFGDDVEPGDVRYLNVAATIAQLLPDDLGPYLLAGATVVRREGRLFATLAVPTGRWAAPETAGSEQADRFSEAGYKVDWTTNAQLGV